MNGIFNLYDFNIILKINRKMVQFCFIIFKVFNMYIEIKEDCVINVLWVCSTF